MVETWTWPLGVLLVSTINRSSGTFHSWQFSLNEGQLITLSYGSGHLPTLSVVQLPRSEDYDPISAWVALTGEHIRQLITVLEEVLPLIENQEPGASPIPAAFRDVLAGNE